MGGNHSFIMEALTTNPSSPTQLSSEDERGWEDVYFKRKHRVEDNRHEAPAEQRRTSPPHGARLVEVCGQCLKPGHMAADCKRAITCRVYGGIGHKGRECRRRAPNHHQTTGAAETKKITCHASPERRREPPRTETQGTSNRRRPEPEVHQEHLKERHTARTISHYHVKVEELHKAGHQKTHVEPEKKTAPTHRKIDHLHASLALDGDMVEGKEEMKTFTVATVTKVKVGFVTGRKMSMALQEFIGDGWEWPVKEFRDGRYLITCRSLAEAREMEKSGELHFPTFTMKCEPWTADIWKVGPADGEIRWLEVRRLPTFCWNRDSAGRVLKTIGDLMFVDRRGGCYVDDIRALVRIRRGRTMPCILWTNIGSRKYKVLVGMERGQDQLPWNGGELGEIGNDMEEEEEGKNQPKKPKSKQETKQKQGLSVNRRMEKGKQIDSSPEKGKKTHAGEDHHHGAATKADQSCI
ncbi:hypothetical protein J5N97_009527 [Dioscorea zingiberensis]|uniref:CCHC-type domain-containing protein n=1 Tax=Dioscorea zingiberensis TaxID=325984 RepID=A0A9D5HMS1_9LILI|nr:hypothetical protein J5N97_009527 [Dioscorea zingiberensis]